MGNKKFVLSLDQGTTSSRAILFDKNFEICGIEQIETKQIYPKPGWVEQDAFEIWETQLYVARKLISKTGINIDEIVSIGVANQRESTVVWDKNTGKPIYNAIIWQDKRSSSFCEEIKKIEIGDYISDVTGLVVDTYFSATKIKWILDNVNGARIRALNGELLFGTIDSWLIWNLTGGKLHATDYSNASRTMIYNIKSLTWYQKILEYFDIPVQMLPKVVDSSFKYGYVQEEVFGKSQILIGGVAGDQQAALFGHNCFNVGSVKNTYGTGCFMLMNTGQTFIKAKNGLVTTIAWGINGKITYALEGSVFIAGAAVKWLRDNLKIIESSQETSGIANSIECTLFQLLLV